MTKTTTVTEALAELKVIGKRIESKQGFVTQNLTREEQLRDPLARDGGQLAVIGNELQALHDLRENEVAIRRAIAESNAQVEVSVNGTTRTIADWLRWRREVAPGEQAFLRSMVDHIVRARAKAGTRGGSLVSASATVSGENKPTDIVVNISEVDLQRRYEELQATLETLDGQLSLKNATVTITY